MKGLAAQHSLALGFGLLMLMSAALLEVLARTVPSLEGPRWWSRSCLCALAGLLLRLAEPWQPGCAMLGEALWLLALGCLAEGLLRVAQGRRRVMPRGTVVVFLYLLVALVLQQRAAPPAQALWPSMALALGWFGVGGLVLMQLRQGQRLILAGIAACTFLAGAGWSARAWLLLYSDAAWPERLGRAEVLMVWPVFVACGLLVLLLVLAVNFRLAERLQRESIRDPLTGALNRRGFEQHTARLAAMSARLGQSLVVLMLDIDHFKQVNDRHGHPVGDLALKSLGQLVLRAKRESDAFARLGGEEFCILLPGTDVPGARVFADRLRRSFAALEIDTGRSFLSCTISIGVAYASAAALQAGEMDLVDLLRQADEALYEAKRAGRNRVRFFASDEVMSSRLDSRLFTSTIPNHQS